MANTPVSLVVHCRTVEPVGNVQAVALCLGSAVGPVRCVAYTPQHLQTLLLRMRQARESVTFSPRLRAVLSRIRCRGRGTEREREREREILQFCW
jgi:hypothetical protein